MLIFRKGRDAWKGVSYRHWVALAGPEQPARVDLPGGGH